MAASGFRAGRADGSGRDLASVATTIGAVAVGAALFEAALIPGIMIGAVAIFAPDLASKSLRKVPRGLGSLFQRSARRPAAARQAAAKPMFPTGVLPRLQVGEALAKTITFRITIATLDFAWNYVVLGELVTAAGLSALNLTVGPFFYFLHEALWNYYSAPERQGLGAETGAIAILPPEDPGTRSPLVQFRGLKVTRATAKTIVYEAMGASAEFTVNLLVVGDVATAAIITAPLVIFGPFIYYGHEKAWEYFGDRAKTGGPKARE